MAATGQQAATPTKRLTTVPCMPCTTHAPHAPHALMLTMPTMMRAALCALVNVQTHESDCGSTSSFISCCRRLLRSFMLACLVADECVKVLQHLLLQHDVLR